METIYDWVTVMIFSGLVIRFISQSMKPVPDDGGVVQYLPPSIGCAIANWLGNEGWHAPAIVGIAGTLWYAYRYLGPGRALPPRP